MDHLIRGSEYLARFPNFRLVGRDLDLGRLTSILMRNRASSVILVGPGGVGCSALCVGVQAAKAAEDAPFDLVSKRLFWLDTNGLFSNGEGVNHAFQKIIGRLNRTPDDVLIIEDTRDFIEACRNNNTTHFINALIALVRDNRLQIIFEAKDDDLDTVLKAHSDTKELFTILPIEEPAGTTLTEIVRIISDGLAAHHGIKVDDDAVLAAIELTNKYHSRDGRAQPERSVTLLDRALAAYRLDVHRHPPGFDSKDWRQQRTKLRELHSAQRAGEVEIGRIDDEIETIVVREQNGSEQNHKVFAGFDTPEVAELKAKAKVYQREVDRNKAEFIALTAEINSRLLLTRDLVLTEFSDISGIPTSKLNQNDVEKLLGLEAALTKRIYGQDDVVRRLANGIKIARVGRRNNNKPLASYLFLGPSGVGKTEITKVLAGVLLDDEGALTRFDMSEYMEKHAVAKLIGAPPGYEGFDAGGILTNLMRRNGNRVLLFDEIEKAHPDIFNVMLQVLEDGRLTDNVGRTVSFADAVIIMTTNIGQPHFLDATLSTEDAEAAAMGDLSGVYRSEFLNRFAGRQNIICFKKLGLNSIQKIVRREINSLDAVYGAKGVHVEISDDVLTGFCADQYDPRIGARGLPGFISANLEPAIVNAILADQELRGTAIVRYDRDGKRFDVEIVR